MTPDGDRPLDDCLATFWQGSFTLHPSPDPTPTSTALADLGPSATTSAGPDLATLLAPIYRHFTEG